MCTVERGRVPLEGADQLWLLLYGVVVFLETLGLKGVIPRDYHEVVELIVLLLLCVED
jgi:hypothetical protein